MVYKFLIFDFTKYRKGALDQNRDGRASSWVGVRKTNCRDGAMVRPGRRAKGITCVIVPGACVLSSELHAE